MKKIKFYKKILKKFGYFLFLWSKHSVSSSSFIIRALGYPVTVFVLSEFKNEIFKYHKKVTKDVKEKKKTLQKRKWQLFIDSRLKYLNYQIICGVPVSESKYIKLLIDAQLAKKIFYIEIFLANGFLSYARLVALNIINGKFENLSVCLQYEICTRAAMIAFLQGLNKEACKLWRKSAEIKQQYQLPYTPRSYRIMGNDWFAAIGHVAMLDYYFKHNKLYGSTPCRFVMRNETGYGNLIAILSRKFSELGLVKLNEKRIEEDYNKWQSENEEVFWDQLDKNEKNSLVDDFWLYEFPDGEALGYAHGASRIQKEWEASGYSPLMHVSKREEKWLTEYKLKIGLPKDAWYVCLHVREAGFHKSWNKLYPTIRDANIDDYYMAIERITSAGGWVIRMGDPSMQPLLDLPNVIDYANSSTRSPYADFLLPATCKFFIGTNSGYATIPVIFGIPCALTNWVPVGWPLWPSQDLMIFKLFRDKQTKRYLSLEELFETGIAFLQNSDDLPSTIEIIDNSPEEIGQLTSEMLDAYIFKNLSLKDSGASNKVMESYDLLAKRYEAFTGSRFGKHFVNQYPEVFDCLSRYANRESEIIPSMV